MVEGRGVGAANSLSPRTQSEIETAIENQENPGPKEEDIQKLRDSIQDLDSQLKKSLRKIAALNLDSEIKDRKLKEVEERVRGLRERLETVENQNQEKINGIPNKSEDEN